MTRLLSLLCAWCAWLSCLPALADQHGTGLASFYAEVPDRSEKLTAAHRSLPFGTMVSVTRVDTGAHVVVRINDRGPFVQGRIIDLSHPAADQLGMVGAGLARVTIKVIPAPVRATRSVLAVPVPVRAIRPVRDREAASRCSACGLPPLLE
jgi:rare lipoprotein A